MSNEEKRYAGLESLRKFLENCKTTFAAITHTHTKSDIEDLVIDTEISATSENPVQNKVISAKISLINDALSDKANAEHNHDGVYYTKTEIDDMEFVTVEDIDTICGATIQSANNVTF